MQAGRGGAGVGCGGTGRGAAERGGANDIVAGWARAQFSSTRSLSKMCVLFVPVLWGIIR